MSDGRKWGGVEGLRVAGVSKMASTECSAEQRGQALAVRVAGVSCSENYPRWWGLSELPQAQRYPKRSVK